VRPERTRHGSASHTSSGKSWPGSSSASRPTWLWARFRHPQLRTRVLAGVLAVILATLAAFGVAAVTALHGYLLAETDTNLQTILAEYYPDLAPSHARVQPPKRPAQPGKTSLTNPVQSLPPLPAIVDGYDIELMTGVGKVRQIVGGDPDLVPRLPANLAQVAAHRGALTVTSRNGRAHLRLTAQSAHGRTLIVATSLQSLDSTLSRLKLIVAFGVLASALLVVAGAGLVIRRGLRPIATMAAAADKITAGDLTRRVSPHDPVTEFGRLGAALNGMLDRVQAAVRERQNSERATRQFFVDASHELRTPLASLRANAELYQQGALPGRSQVDEAMRRITAEARRMGDLVDGMLRLARLDQHPRPSHEPVDVSALAVECTERARTSSPRHIWQPRITAGLITTGDEEMLRRAIDNLLANIATHTPGGTTATITASPTGGTITLEVSDDGPGVASDQLPRIFDRFYRAPTEEHHNGSGLGLAIVTAIACAHHGTAHATLNHPHGLRVVLILPADRQTSTAQLSARTSA